MCRVEERVYIKADGQRQKFEDPFPCHKSKHGKLCSNVKRKTTEYYPKLKPIIRDSRDGTVSPASYDPPTPDGTGSYLVQQHRPSIIERRLSTREGSRAVRPEIIIEFGPKKDKDRSKKYPAIPVKNYNRSSLGAAPTNENDFAIESPGSDASFTVRTGLADNPVLLTNPYQQPPSSYSTRPAMPHNHHRHTSSASSFTTSSQPPSLYATSEPESPTDQRTPRFPPTIVHNPPQFTTSQIQTRATPAAPSSATFHINFPAPQDTTPRLNIGPDNLFPLDYSEFRDRSAPSSHASSGHASSGHASSGHASSGRAAAPEIIDRANERDRLRRLNKENEKRRQEEDSRLLAQKIAQEQAQTRAKEEEKQVRLLAQQIAQEQAQTRAKEEEKQVRFELDRYKDRENQRAEARLAESERRRAEERLEARARKQKEQDERDALAAKEEKRARKQKEQDERDALAAKEEKRAKADRLAADLRKEKAIKDTEAKLMGREPRPRDSRPPTRDMPNTTRHRTRRPSISRAQAQERDLLLAETEAQMAREREATEQREREETAALLRQQQQTSQYYDPRGGARNPITIENPGLGGRRGSVSGRRPSISTSGPPPPTSLGRTSSQRRSSVIHQVPQTNLPPINTQYSTRPPSAHRNQSASLFSPAGSRPPSARHSSYGGQENPFAAPPTRTSQENPFAPAPGVAQPMPPHDPWDTRNMREALPQAIQPQIRQPSTALGIEQPHTLKRRGEDVISRAAEDRSSRARQATRSMRMATGFEDDYESEEENVADKSASYATKVRKEKRKH